MIMKRVFLFTDADIDGAGCVWILKKALEPECKVEYKVVTRSKFRKDFNSFIEQGNYKKYSKIFICDLSVWGDIDIVDRKDVTIFDHHDDHIKTHNYKNATCFIKNSPSTTELMYDVLCNEVEMTKYQKLLVKIISDYDNYTLSIKYSKPLNYIFWNYTGNRVEKFLTDFKDGFKGFNRYHNNALKLIEKEYKDFMKNGEFFKGALKIGEKEYTCLGTFCDINPNTIAEEAFKKFGGDIIFIINIKSKTVSFRRSKECTLDLVKLSSAVADGGGHSAASGGKLTKQVMAIASKLYKIQ